MNLLFLNQKIKKYCILIIFVSFYCGIHANDNTTDQTFIEQCKNSDAYILYSYTDVTYLKNWNNYKRHTSIHSKLVINTRLGVENYAFLNISEFVREHLVKIQINTLKADGTVISPDSSLIFQNQKDIEIDEMNYPIPGVEPGDTIEISYEYFEYLDEYELKDFVILHSNVPSLNTEYTVRTSPALLVRYKSYNGFPKPQVLSNDTIIYCLFKMENIEGLPENQYTCLPCELPYVFYSVEKRDSEAKTWKDVYNFEFNIITQPVLIDHKNASYYKKWKKKVIGEADDSSKFYKFNLFYNDILNNINIEQSNRNELIKSSGYFLKEKRIDPNSIRRLYRQILEDLEIDYWAIFARSKRMGDIDPYFIRNGEFDHIFFAYENSEGALRLIYPHEIGHKYQIDEIPTSLYNTKAVIAKPYLTEKIKRRDKYINYDFKMAEVDSVIIDVIILPGMNANYNFLKQVFYCDIDIKNKTNSLRLNFNVSGGLSTEVRSFFNLLNQNKELNDFYEALSEFEGDESSFNIDTVLNTELRPNKPFMFSINSTGSFTKGLTYINDSIVSITLGDLIQHSQVESELDSIKLNYYLDYNYTDFVMLILQFPVNVEILNSENHNKNIKNNYGEYIFSLDLFNNNQLIIKSNYKIISDFIPKNDYGQLKQLNEQVKEIKNIRILVKLKNL